MKPFYVRKLLFALVTSPDLVTEITDWRIQNVDNEKHVPELSPNYKKHPGRAGRNFSDGDYRAAILMVTLLNALDEESLRYKVKELQITGSRGSSFLERNLPLSLSREELEYWAQNMNWSRCESALLSLGFVLNSRSIQDFSNTMFARRAKEFTRDFFPLLSAFIDRDRLLVNSGLFKNSTANSHLDKAPAISVVSWLVRMKIQLPGNLVDTVKALQVLPQNAVVSTADSIEAPINSKLHSSLLLMINAMAREKFFYKPGENLGPAKRAIYLALQDRTLGLSEKTIGKHLRASQEEANRIKDKSQ